MTAGDAAGGIGWEWDAGCMVHRTSPKAPVVDSQSRTAHIVLYNIAIIGTLLTEPSFHKGGRRSALGYMMNKDWGWCSILSCFVQVSSPGTG